MGHLKAYPCCLIAIAVLSVFTCISGSAQKDNSVSSERSPFSAIKEKTGLTGSVRFGYWSATRNLDEKTPVGSVMLWGKAKRDFTPDISAFGESWLASRGPIDGGETRGELREAYLDLKLARFDLRAGRQIFAWGRADAINPTANLSGEDLTLMAPDSEDRKFGTTAIRARYFLPHTVSVSGIWLPEFRPTRFPFPKQGSGSTFDRQRPQWPADQFAFRVERSGSAIDWSASYFEGYDLLPDLSVGNDSPNSEQTKISYHRMRVLGADGAANIGRYGFRVEAAYAFTQNPTGKNPFLKQPYFFLILGGDRTYGGELNINLQYMFRLIVNDPFGVYLPDDAFAKQVADEEAIIGNQTARMQHGASARVGDKWLHETLEGELGVVGYFNPQGILVRPKITYSLSDHWKTLIGGEVYRGDDRSVFGFLRSNSLAYVETRFSF